MPNKDESKPGLLPDNTPEILAMLDDPLKVVGLIVIVALGLTVAFFSVGETSGLRDWYPFAVLGLLALVAVLMVLQSNRKSSRQPAASIVGSASLADHARGGTFVGTGNINFGDTFAPSTREQEIQSDITNVKQILNQFDRKAVTELMHTEDISLMVDSLKDLRIQIQKLGKSTIQDRELRLLVGSAATKLEYVSELASQISRYPGNWHHSIFDLRTFGTLAAQPGCVANDKLAQAQAIVSTALRQRYGKAMNQDFHRLAEIRENASDDFTKASRDLEEFGKSPANVPLDVETLSWDFAVFYIFGALDQLKSDVGELLDKSLQRLSELSAELK